MRTEVHVHGNLRLVKGATLAQIESGLRPWLDYLDIDSIEEARSLEQDEPGLAFDTQTRELTICWTGEVGRNFHRCVDDCMKTLGPITESTSVIEVTYYHEDGHDEVQLIFVGPTAEAVHEAQRARMIEDVSYLLSRHFGKEAVDRVASLVNELFSEEWSDRSQGGESQTTDQVPFPRNKHLH